MDGRATHPTPVLQWTSLEESPQGPPAVLPPPRPIGEIIAEQSIYNPLEENEDEQADWWKGWGDEGRQPPFSGSDRKS